MACTPETTVRSMSVTPFGDFRFRRVPSQLCHEELIIHQLKYPHDDADVDINVLRDRAAPEMAAEGVRDVLTDIFAVSSAIAMEPEKFERTVARDIAEVVVSERKADVALLATAYSSAISPWD